MGNKSSTSSSSSQHNHDLRQLLQELVLELNVLHANLCQLQSEYLKLHDENASLRNEQRHMLTRIIQVEDTLQSLKNQHQ